MRRVPPYVPVDRPSCASCRVFTPEVIVPVDGVPDTVRLCWGCAHAVVDHNASTETAYAVFAQCTCPAHDVYPEDVRTRVVADVEPLPAWCADGSPRAEERLNAELERRLAPKSTRVPAAERSRLAKIAASQTHKHRRS